MNRVILRMVSLADLQQTDMMPGKIGKTAPGCVRRAMETGLNGALALLEHLPTRCVVCEAAAIRSNLCELCLTDLPRLPAVCRRCALPVGTGTLCGPCIINPPPWQSMTCAVPYETPYDTLISRLKFRGHQTVAPALGTLMIEALEKPQPHSAFTHIGSQTLRFPDVIVPVPLHWYRLWQRGFNQAALLAEPLSQHFDIEIIHALKRHRYTRAQTLLDTHDRVANVRSAFRINLPVEGRHVALLDDVTTTCATVAAASLVLLRSGAASVHVWSCARARSKHPSHSQQKKRRSDTHLSNIKNRRLRRQFRER